MKPAPILLSILVLGIAVCGCEDIKWPPFEPTMVNRPLIEERLDRMADNADFSNMSIAGYHFVPHTRALTSLGEDRLDRYAPFLEEYGGTLRVQPNGGSEALNSQRLATVREYLSAKGISPARMGLAPVDVPVDAWNVYQPDVVAWREDLEDDAPYDRAGVPLLVVEVLSPSSAARDRHVKRVRLLDAGVDEVWLVDRERGTVEVYDRGRYRDVPRRASGAQELASRVLEGFALVPAALFGR